MPTAVMETAKRDCRFAVSITPTKPTIGAFLAVTLNAAIFVN